MWWYGLALIAGSMGVVTLPVTPALAGDRCAALGFGNARAIHGALLTALGSVAPNKGANGGLGNEMWGTIVDQDGVVCAVVFTGGTRIDQWPGSRVISAQKANTAAAFNLPVGVGGTVDALSTANLWKQVQPGGTLFGLQFSNPVDPAVAYGNNPEKYGRPDDPLVGRLIGGVNVFGGGLALYNQAGQKVGGLGVSGDTSCADHNIAWRARHALNLDFLTTAGVAGLTAAPLQDNIIYDVTNAFGHPTCGFGEDSKTLPATQ
jgi:uncharacterized protein GlcG (DUF336 family)